jgi:hypothetical protein
MYVFLIKVFINTMFISKFQAPVSHASFSLIYPASFLLLFFCYTWGSILILHVVSKN